MTDNVLKSAYAGMVLRQVASHAFRKNCQDVIFLQRKLSLNIDRLVSKEHKIIEFRIGLSKIQIYCIEYEILFSSRTPVAKALKVVIR